MFHLNLLLFTMVSKFYSLYDNPIPKWYFISPLASLLSDPLAHSVSTTVECIMSVLELLISIRTFNVSGSF
jgi:hypothetical protein